MFDDKSTNSPKPLKILLFVTGLGVGGAERVVLETASKMSKHCQVVIVTIDENKDLLSQYPHVGFEVLSLGLNKEKKSSFFSALWKILNIARNRKFDIVHAHMFHALIAAIFLKILRPRIKIVFTSHSFGGFSGYRCFLIKLTCWLRSADVIFSKNQHPGMNARCTVVIPNGVLVNEIPQIRNINKKNKFVFLHLGRLEAVKNTIFLLEQFESMKNKNCELWFAGDGSLRSTLEAAIEKKSLKSSVFLLGIQKDIKALFATADCIVMASLWEGLPMALLEAGANALPVIAPPVGAIPELLSDECGYLVSHKDLARTMDLVAANPGDGILRGCKLKEKIMRGYSVDRAVELHEILYENVRR